MNVLRRIADDTDPITARQSELANTVYALRNRGLVVTPRQNGVWRARITEAGRFYLEHGHHPDRPTAEESDIKSAPKDLAADLIRRLQLQEGTIQLENPTDDVRGAYRRAISAAKRRGLVPEGFQLLHTGRDKGPLIIKLAPAGRDVETEWNRIRLAARNELTGADLFAKLDRDGGGIEVSDSTLPRARQLLHTLSQAAERRGHVLGMSRKTGRLYIRVREHLYTIGISEGEDQVPRPLAPDDWRLQGAYSWQRITPREYDSVPNGVLHLTLGTPPNVDHSWRDKERSKLENRIKEIVDAAEQLADHADERRREAEREHREWRIKCEREQAERDRRDAEVRARWEAAMAEARVLAVEDLRKKAFEEALAGWRAAAEIRAFCSALEEATDGTAAHGWLAWGRAWADLLDPLRHPADFLERFSPEPQADDLRPHLGEWSPYRPERECRSTPPPAPSARNVASEARTSGWRWGRQGPFPWWRR
ncbi:hypothetical protein [Thermoactinospora rubra]|uniref:hypothetical protein n=1 Tax=Thermoactinospora rubra TaxID=1088767 RepID=UPI00197DC542|nr:hypothetical protein [Thermoactinospora rubra]